MQNETKRQIEHMVPVAFATLLRWLPLWAAASLAGLSVVYGALVSPRVFRRMLRSNEASHTFSPGKFIYGVVVLVLILVFGVGGFHIVAGAWALMGIGDGMSNIIGRRYGRVKVAWNRSKTWEGFAAFVVFGTLAAGFLVWWVALREEIAPVPFERAMLLALVAAVAAGLVETSRGKYVDDNISVPVVGALVLYLLLVGFRMDPTLSVFLALALNFVLGVAAYRAGAVSLSGLVAGLVIGTAVALSLALPGFLLLAVFFVLGSGATRWGYAAKKTRGVAQESGGRRGWLHATANGIVPAGCAVLAMLGARPGAGPWTLAFAAALATAAMDTVSSELGTLYGRTTVLPPTFRRVKPGTAGAVSVEGTLLGLLAAALVALAAFALGLIGGALCWVVLVSAFAGTTAESLLGAAGLGKTERSSSVLNLINTAVGAGAALLLGVWIVS
ncbi:MAG TPA: DUF92 domain-containing protein [Planctomycetota bacterium]|nr:DUF92 domain-containing protein [Planctomycetota bacterium]